MEEKRDELIKKKQIDFIIKSIQNLGGLATYSQIYEEYGRITGAEMTFGRKASVRKTIEMHSSNSEVFAGTNVFYTPKKGSGVWGLVDKYQSIANSTQEKKDEVLKKPKTQESTLSRNLPKRAKTPEEKLYKKIFRLFDKKTYIGDIIITDDEYKLLLDYLKTKLSSLNPSSVRKEDPIFAVALVQIGIREYNGRYWPHVSRLTQLNIDSNKQSRIGEKFYRTLLAHDRIHLEQNEIVNNILMHCFVTKHYAADFFEFLFAYYQYDLDRDLDLHKEMRDNLLACMKKAEDSPRAFRIKKGTADAATANEKGCKIRIKNILKWIDSFLFEDKLPDQSPNRTAQFFIEWAKTSKRFSKEKTAYYSRGKKHFRYPFLHFDFKSETFSLELPVQTVPLSNEEESASLSWRFICGDISESFKALTENTVIGCRTVDVEHIPISPKDIFSEFQVELIKNEESVVKKFIIKRDAIRFFDGDYDLISRERLPAGTVFAVTERGVALETDAQFSTDHYLGLDFHALELLDGNIVKKPDGIALSVGKELKEGLRDQFLVEGAYIKNGDIRLSVFCRAPSVLVKMKQSSQTGTLIIVNGDKTRLDPEKCIVFKQDTSDYYYYLINLDSYCVNNDYYQVEIDIPSDRKNRSYQFVIIRDFGYEFAGAPYIYRKKGKLILKNDISAVMDGICGNEFEFSIIDNLQTLQLFVNEICVAIDVPVFRWKYRLDDDWCAQRPEELWYKEMPDYFYFSLPAKDAFVYSDQVVFDEDDQPQKIHCTYDVQNDCLVCDTRRIKSWLELGTAKNALWIHFSSYDFRFLDVITSCILVACSLSNNPVEHSLILKSTIMGFSDCVVDIYNEGELIADKCALTSNGATISTNKIYGKYELVFYEFDDDEDDFGEAVYSEFARKYFKLKQTNSLIGKNISLDYITQDTEEHSIFSADKYYIKDKLTIQIDKQDEEEPNVYYGVTKCLNTSLAYLKVQVELIDPKDSAKALLFFFDKEEDCFVDFIYDKASKTLVIKEDDTLSAFEIKKRYLSFTAQHYYHISYQKK